MNESRHRAGVKRKKNPKNTLIDCFLFAVGRKNQTIPYLRETNDHMYIIKTNDEKKHHSDLISFDFSLLPEKYLFLEFFFKRELFDINLIIKELF
jgi:hypothetical protein